MKKAPIVEALIDLMLGPQHTVDLKNLKILADQLSGEFPKCDEIRIAQLKLPPSGSGIAPEVSHLPPVGYKLTSSNGSEVVQLKTDGFTFNQLPPYQDWDYFFRRFKHLWELYQKTAKATELRRVGLRYINNLQLPLPLKFLKDYLAAPPVVPAGMPQEISDYVMRVVVPLADISGGAIITQALGRGPHSGQLPLILDIDVFTERAIKTADKTLWDLLLKMREHKNNIFYKSITEKTVELYS